MNHIKGTKPNLVLRRERGESIVIDTGSKLITLTYVGMDGKQAKIGFRAARDIKIDRLERYLEKNPLAILDR